jgi:hypothetical protein
MAMDDMITTCPDCSGSGRWFDMSPAKQNRKPGEMGPSDCTTCSGWALVPTSAGRPFFAMIIAMRKSPKWR